MAQQTNSSTWCKICGVTDLGDAQAALAAGADALGFNCYEGSPRYLDAERVSALTAQLETTRVAVFVDAARERVEELLALAQIDLLQFHGDEDETFCASFGKPYMKAVRMAEDLDVAEYMQAYPSAWAYLLDAFVPGQPGGTGERFDWSRWPEPAGRRLILAGGLMPANVAQAINTLRPFGVDVAGGVEGEIKGRKDPVKLRNFLQEVRSAGG